MLFLLLVFARFAFFACKSPSGEGRNKVVSTRIFFVGALLSAMVIGACTALYLADAWPDSFKIAFENGRSCLADKITPQIAIYDFLTKADRRKE